jgi:hypothetical protein
VPADVSAWAVPALRTFLVEGGQLEALLGLRRPLEREPGQSWREAAIRERNRHLRILARWCTDGPPWTRAETIHRWLRTFRPGVETRAVDDLPTLAASLLALVHQSGAPVPTSVRQIYRILSD